MHSNTTSYDEITAEVESLGGQVEYLGSSFDASELEDIDVLLIGSNLNTSTTMNGIVNNWIQEGGGVFFDYLYNYDFNSIVSGSGLSYSTVNTYGGNTTNITNHPVTDGISTYYNLGSANSILVSGDALSIVKDTNNNIAVAVSELGEGRIVASSEYVVYELSLIHI